LDHKVPNSTIKQIWGAAIRKEDPMQRMEIDNEPQKKGVHPQYDYPIIREIRFGIILNNKHIHIKVNISLYDHPKWSSLHWSLYLAKST